MKFDGRVLLEQPKELIEGKRLVRASGKPREAWFGTWEGERVLIKRDSRARIALSVNEMKPLFDLKRYEAVLIVGEPDALVVKWYDDAMDLGRLGKRWAERDDWVDEFWKMIAFDQIHSMGDRYEANVVARSSGELIPIDEISSWMWDRPINRMYGKLVNARLIDRKATVKQYCTRVQSMGGLGWALVDSVLGRYWTPEIVRQVRAKLEERTKTLHHYLWKLIGRMLADVRPRPKVGAGEGNKSPDGNRSVPEVRKPSDDGVRDGDHQVQRPAVRAEDDAGKVPAARSGPGGVG